MLICPYDGTPLFDTVTNLSAFTDTLITESSDSQRTIDPSLEKAKPSPIDFSEIRLTPIQIYEKIEKAALNNRDDVRRAFAGVLVDWTLSFFSASRTENTILIVLQEIDTDYHTVLCRVPLAGNERFPLVDRGDRFRVRGTIEEVDPLSINLMDVLIEKIPDDSK